MFLSLTLEPRPTPPCFGNLVDISARRTTASWRALLTPEFTLLRTVMWVLFQLYSSDEILYFRTANHANLKATTYV